MKVILSFQNFLSNIKKLYCIKTFNKLGNFKVQYLGQKCSNNVVIIVINFVIYEEVCLYIW
jgi:hypothetical protein